MEERLDFSQAVATPFEISTVQFNSTLDNLSNRSTGWAIKDHEYFIFLANFSRGHIMRYFSLALLCLVFLLPYPASAEGQQVQDAENIDYLIDSIDLNNGTFSPGTAENGLQEIMSDYMNKIVAQNNKTQTCIALVGPIEFETMSSLSVVEHIVIFQDNLKQYKAIKKNHYDSLDGLMKDANTKLGKLDLAKKRLGGGGQYYEEQLEAAYLNDLKGYYEFLIKNHDSLVFQGEEILGTNDNVVAQYNIVLERMVTSAKNLNDAQNMKNTLLRKRIDEAKNKKQ